MVGSTHLGCVQFGLGAGEKQVVMAHVNQALSAKSMAKKP